VFRSKQSSQKVAILSTLCVLSMNDQPILVTPISIEGRHGALFVFRVKPSLRRTIGSGVSGAVCRYKPGAMVRPVLNVDFPKSGNLPNSIVTKK